jgi:hypothetical protein
MKLKRILAVIALSSVSLCWAAGPSPLPAGLVSPFPQPPNSTLSNGLMIDSSGNIIIAAAGGTPNIITSLGFPLDSSGRLLVNCATGCGVSFTPLYPEGYLSWQPGTLYPQALSGTCVFAAATTCTIAYPTTFASVPVVNITPVNPGAVTFTVTTSSTTQIVITGSGSNSLTVNYSATLPSGINCSTNTFTLTGARQNLDFVTPLWPSALPANLSAIMRASASDTIEVRLCNPTAATITFSAALTFGAKLFR